METASIPIRLSLALIPVSSISVLAAESSRPHETTGAIETYTHASEPAWAGGCPGTGDCCESHVGLGCDDFSCCDAVCFVDDYCCIVSWDDDCATLAHSFCAALCAEGCGGTGDCCSAHLGRGCNDAFCCDLICTALPSCCNLLWTAACAELANVACAVCAPPFVCPQPGDCCTSRFFTGGCEREACCRTVCEFDEFCCDGEWDDICAQNARSSCQNVCDCPLFGNFGEDPSIDLRDAAAFQNCYSGADSAPVPAECACADYDGDGDADQVDLIYFIAKIAAP